MRYQVVTTTQAFSFPTRKAFYASAKRAGYKRTGFAHSTKYAEIDGQPIFDGLLGPMYGGPGVVRYETQKAYNILSRENPMKMKRYHRPHRTLARLAKDNPLVGFNPLGFNPLSSLPKDIGGAALLTGLGAGAGAGIGYAMGKNGTALYDASELGMFGTAALGGLTALMSKKYREMGLTTAVLSALTGIGVRIYNRGWAGAWTTAFSG